MRNSDMPWRLMAYLHAINMQLKRFPKLAECDTAKQVRSETEEMGGV